MVGAVWDGSGRLGDSMSSCAVTDTDAFSTSWRCWSRPRRSGEVSFRRFTVVIGGAVKGIAGEGGYFIFIQRGILIGKNVTGHARHAE